MAFSVCLLCDWTLMCCIFSRLPAIFVPTKTALFLFAFRMFVPSQVFIFNHLLTLLLIFLLSPWLKVGAQSWQVTKELLQGTVAIEQGLRLGAVLFRLFGIWLKVAIG